IQRHVRKMRRLYQRRLDVFVSALRRRLGGFLTFRIPSGGTAIWVRTTDARTMMRWVEASSARSVVFDPPTEYSFRRNPMPAARLGFASSTEHELRAAAARLASAATLAMKNAGS